ncbi:voltage-gated potassium channel [Halobacillus karajensis]|uniref:Voltage-gated potassium channel Kch n=1 Tax=Halobacillus karajensis TaxID=195088 RepID=A0A024P7I0_9BACI|nr:potassium channel family protein [Halobacillus karajensis]CDQ18349.1 Voltage-gated potassium channel Kch [Halobacillus karajensis]CDQ24703.1 Voltage-gated potassium channel Kch [Halobacillus karajensis]CDQ29051.1 Voltage-gated potassium channel Kch [Halobacillus karajensis]SEI06710.1 voltage-gated potassium channel [Halobacillus karajensis]
MVLLRKFFLKMVNISNVVLFIASALLILLSTIFIVIVENDTFPTLFDGFWWVMTTVTTVGYGDYYPVTVAGRSIAILLYVLGIGLIGIVIGKIIDGFAIFRKKRLEGDIVYKENGHFVIIGWSQKAHFAVKEFIETNKECNIVIIDQLKEAPILTENIHYIKGDASDTDILEKANISGARSVLIFADDQMENEQMIDGKTLLIASSIETVAPGVHTIVEVMEERHIKNFKHAQIDEFIVSNETISSLAVRSAFRKGVSGIYGQLLKRSVGEDLYYIPTKSVWKTYRDAFQSLLEEGGYVNC